jgi:AcrR family transcriptional regulator
MPDSPAVRRQPRSAVRRSQVLEAALACFSEHGIAATAIEDICSNSGASVGSIYHLFGSKDGLAAALYLDAVASFQAAVMRRLKPPTGALEAVLAIIAAHIDWVEKHPAHARFLQQARHTPTVAACADAMALRNRDFALHIGAWAKSHVDGGRLRKMPVDLLMAQLLGPTHEYVRGRLAGREPSAPGVAKRLLGQAAWRALGVDQGSADSRFSQGMS